MTRSGIVTVVGKPNAGKSTLLNRIVGQKLSITSPKPQTTRDRIVGIHTAGDVQFVLFDTPGLLNPRYALQAAMRGSALAALRDADVIAYVVDASEGMPRSLQEAADLTAPPRARVLTVHNKADLLKPEQRARLDALDDAIVVSAVTGEGVDDLVARLGAALPESPFLYDPDDVSTQSMRFFASELIRETALEQLEDEVPYSVACEIEEYREDRSPLYIRAVVHVERDSQKRILIGAKGARIREIGRAARVKLEALAGAPVYLDLWVKVLPNWRRKPAVMQRFGYRIATEGERR